MTAGARELRWLRCAKCFLRRFVVPSEGWPVCCGVVMETQESGLLDRGSFEPQVTDAALGKPYGTRGNLLSSGRHRFSIDDGGIDVPDSGGSEGCGEEARPTSDREDSQRNLGVDAGGCVGGHPLRCVETVPDAFSQTLERTRAYAVDLDRAQERLDEGVRLLLGAATAVLLLAEHVQAQQRCVEKLVEMKEDLVSDRKQQR